MIARDLFRQGFRRLASGVSCVTTVWQERPYGFLATSVSSLSSDPPALIVCVNRGAASHEALLNSGVLCVNVLSQNAKGMAAAFADSGKREERFASCDWTRLKTGAPVLGDAFVAFDCEIDKSIPYASHTILVCRIVDGFVSEGAPEAPLLYFDGAFRELAMASAS